MKIYINPKTKAVHTEEELKNLFKEMQDNGVEFVDKFDKPYRGSYVNQRVMTFTYRYKNADNVVDFIIDRITI